MNQLACGIRGCWPIDASTTEVLDLFNDTTTDDPIKAFIEIQPKLINLLILVICAVEVCIVGALLIMLKACRRCRCLRQRNRPSNADGVQPVKDNNLTTDQEAPLHRDDSQQQVRIVLESDGSAQVDDNPTVQLLQERSGGVVSSDDDQMMRIYTNALAAMDNER
ncbi:uncharacterized protein LOC134223412 [Armigeres subalbatus]|uniref:uncharacterized protein LOC134223412 n=1 Tax=Armigeres subalbatus TaxID=124917 RepID=UPI002ED64A8B